MKVSQIGLALEIGVAKLLPDGSIIVMTRVIDEQRQDRGLVLFHQFEHSKLIVSAHLHARGDRVFNGIATVVVRELHYDSLQRVTGAVLDLV